MNESMRKIMEQSWREWHCDTNDLLIPNVSMAYEKGFTACHESLMPLLIEAMPHVYASAGAAHLTGGFRPQRKKIDEFVDRIEAVITE